MRPTDVEKIEGWVLDLEGAWQEDQDRTAVYVEPGSTRLVFDIDLPASPTIVWEWVNSANHQRQWQLSAASIDMRHPRGVWGVGTISHCVHGKVAMVHEVVDSKPFAYFTLRTTLPSGGPSPPGSSPRARRRRRHTSRSACAPNNASERGWRRGSLRRAWGG